LIQRGNTKGEGKDMGEMLVWDVLQKGFQFWVGTIKNKKKC